MRFHVLASDYDGTLAEQGRVSAATVSCLEALRRTGRRVILVTGRQIEDLTSVCPRLDLFDWVVGENGGVLYQPLRKAMRTLGESPPEGFVRALRGRRVPISVGQVVVATHEPYQDVVLDVIREMGLELQVIFNKGAVMVLPTGMNKASGLAAALASSGYSLHNTLGVGDGENDHALLSACEAGVAVGNAVETLKTRADHVAHAPAAEGVRVVVRALMEDEKRLYPRADGRNLLHVGATAQHEPVTLDAFSEPVLIAGHSGSGKSTVALTLIEQLADRNYQYCILDPEGDYRGLPGAIVLGEGHPPDVREVVESLASTHQNVVVNLLEVPFDDRPAFFESLFTRVQELRARHGRPHWIVVDEAHHVLPESRLQTELTFPLRMESLMLITVHPAHVRRSLMKHVRTAVAVGAQARDTLMDFAIAAGVSKPGRTGGELMAGEALIWRPDDGLKPQRFRLRTPRTERRRHIRKYAFGQLGPDKSFYFRGPDKRLNLRVQNLQLFLQVAEGVDDLTWLHHLERHDYSRWLRECIKDEALAEELEQVEHDLRLDPVGSRARVRAAIETRYTGPA